MRPCASCRDGISIHSLRMEGDHNAGTLQSAQHHFNPLPPHGGRRNATVENYLIHKYFNPLPPHGGRPAICTVGKMLVGNFNPLPPHGGRPGKCFTQSHIMVFQSTPSTRRETSEVKYHEKVHCISIHSLHTEGDTSCNHKSCTFCISIHSLHTEGDI